MSRTTPHLFRPLGRLRVPTLAFLAGVGFFVSGLQPAAGTSSPAPVPAGASGAALEPGYTGSTAALLASPGLAALGPLGETHAVKRLPGGRGPGQSDAGAPRHGDGRGDRVRSAWRPGTPGSLAATAAAVYAGATARRAGRLSAPSTAPPLLPF